MPAKRKSKRVSKKTKNQRNGITIHVNSHNRRKSSVVKQGGGGGGNIPFFQSVQPAAAPQIIFLQQPEQPRHHLGQAVRLPIMDDLRQQRERADTANPVREEEKQEQVSHASIEEQMRINRLRRFEKDLNMQRKNDQSDIASSRGHPLDGRDILDTDSVIPALEPIPPDEIPFTYDDVIPNDVPTTMVRQRVMAAEAERARAAAAVILARGGTMINPVTGRRITIGGSVYNKLVNEGKIIA